MQPKIDMSRLSGSPVLGVPPNGSHYAKTEHIYEGGAARRVVGVLWPTVNVVLIAMYLLLNTGCTTTYHSVADTRDGTVELIIATEADLLDAVHVSIGRTFPTTVITSLGGSEKGFSFFTQPMLDRTTYKFILVKARATADHADVEGFTYAIYAYGTQGLVQSRYIDPLLEELNRVLVERQIRRLRVRPADVKS